METMLGAGQYSYFLFESLPMIIEKQKRKSEKHSDFR